MNRSRARRNNFIFVTAPNCVSNDTGVQGRGDVRRSCSKFDNNKSWDKEDEKTKMKSPSLRGKVRLLTFSAAVECPVPALTTLHRLTVIEDVFRTSCLMDVKICEIQQICGIEW